MFIKKLPYYLLVALLTLGASVILGFLSFTGMLALTPLLGLAIAAFALSVVYEAEIYSQNIRSALNKIFRMDYLRRLISLKFLHKFFPWQDNHDKTNQALLDEAPQLFKDYHQAMANTDKTHKALGKKLLKSMEKSFLQHLENPAATSESDLQDWLKNKQLHGIFAQALRRKRVMYALAGVFSVITAIFMSVGTSYLLMESLTSVSLFAFIPVASLPAIIIPLSIIAGIAYGMLTFNSITDMINNNTLVLWARKIKGYWVNKEGRFQPSIRGVLLSLIALALTALAVTLTILTAGTWWTVVQKTKPVMDWLSALPRVIMGIIHPIIAGTAALSFNLSNTAETLDMIEAASKKGLGLGKGLAKIFKKLRKTYHTEGLLGFLNPFRLLYRLIYTPVRLLLFMGHLIGIGVTSDRVPEMNEILAAILGIISETFEDAHYFFGHEHGHSHGHSLKKKVDHHLASAHGHHHGLDIPSLILRTLLWPLKKLDELWSKYLAKTSSSEENSPILAVQPSGEERPLPVERVKAFVTQKLSAQPDHSIAAEIAQATSVSEIGTILRTDTVRKLGVFGKKMPRYFPETKPDLASGGLTP